MTLQWPTIKDIVTALAAFIGMFLGFYNLVRERNRDKVRLIVTPKSVIHITQQRMLTSEDNFAPHNNAGLFGMEIVNLSKFPVVIDQVGFLIKGTKKRLSIVPILPDGKEWPRKLESREAVGAYGYISELNRNRSIHLIKCAYAQTACGHIGRGTSGALKDLIRHGKESKF